jgi:hypothetical protein
VVLRALLYLSATANKRCGFNEHGIKATRLKGTKVRKITE